MRKVRTVIVDDEVLGRARVRKLLQEDERVAIVGEGNNGNEASQFIRDYKPDLVFLDIEMPDISGLQVVDTLHPDDRPFVVFVTAHDQFALKAFDLKATDFVLKPFDDIRFKRALDHAISQIEMREQSLLNGQLLRIMEDYKSQSQSNPFMITVKIRGGEKKVNLYDVVFIEADGNYLKLQLEKERYLIRNTMQQMLEALDPKCFLRIHRSTIINTNYLKMKSYRGNNEYVFKMRNGDEFVSGRSHKEDIESFFN